MSHLPVVEPYVMKEIPNILNDYFVLDVACGLGIYAYKIRVGKSGTPIIIGLDLWKPYLKKIKPLRVFDDLILADAVNLPFRSSCFDIVLASAVIEHLPRSKGKKLLSEIERVSKNLVIVVSPCGFMPQKEIDGDPYQKHLSAWQPRDFKVRGYIVRTVDLLQFPKSLSILYKIAVFVSKRFSGKNLSRKK